VPGRWARLGISVPAGNQRAGWPGGNSSAAGRGGGRRGLARRSLRLCGFDGAYLRFAGELRIEHYTAEKLVDSHADDALWELMYFGKARP